MPGFFAAAGRALMGGRPVDAARNRRSRRAIGETPSREGFASKAANIGFAVQSWSSLFERWFPSVTLVAKVTAQGDKQTSNKAVLHTALSIAFGTLQNRRLANLGLMATVNHTTNTVTIGYAVTTNTPLDLVNLMGVVVDQATKLDDNLIVRGIRAAVVPWWVDWIKKRNEDAPPPKPDDLKKAGAGGNLLDGLKAIVDRVNKEIGGAAVWTLPKEEIVGGRPPLLVRTNEPQIPFDDMAYQVQLTRKPADNPQPPSATGKDLRSLVAQILHDPGVRPSLPQTDKGPPTVDDEIKGK